MQNTASTPISPNVQHLATEQAQLQHEHQQLESMLQRALRSTCADQNRQYLQLSRQHNKRLLAYKLALLDACHKIGIPAKGIQIQYDPISQLFQAHSRHNPADRYPLERALNLNQLPDLARSTRDFLDVTRALEQLEHSQQPASTTATTATTATIQDRVA